MDIGKPIKELPVTARRVSSHAALWAVVEEAAGDWVPVTCETRAERTLLQSAAGSLSRWGRRPKMQTVCDITSLTLYIRVPQPPVYVPRRTR